MCMLVCIHACVGMLVCAGMCVYTCMYEGACMFACVFSGAYVYVPYDNHNLRCTSSNTILVFFVVVVSLR